MFVFLKSWVENSTMEKFEIDIQINAYACATRRIIFHAVLKFVYRAETLSSYDFQSINSKKKKNNQSSSKIHLEFFRGLIQCVQHIDIYNYTFYNAWCNFDDAYMYAYIQMFSICLALLWLLLSF